MINVGDIVAIDIDGREPTYVKVEHVFTAKALNSEKYILGRRYDPETDTTDPDLIDAWEHECAVINTETEGDNANEED